jgi:hypothetical protein
MVCVYLGIKRERRPVARSTGQIWSRAVMGWPGLPPLQRRFML